MEQKKNGINDVIFKSKQLCLDNFILNCRMSPQYTRQKTEQAFIEQGLQQQHPYTIIKQMGVPFQVGLAVWIDCVTYDTESKKTSMLELKIYQA